MPLPRETIRRSGRAPNCSFYTNWINERDTISWNADVQIDGEYQAHVYYTCSEGDLGTVLELSCGESAITKEVTVAERPASSRSGLGPLRLAEVSHL